MRRAVDVASGLGGLLTELWRLLAVVGPAAAGLRQVAQAGAVAAEGGRPLQLVHGDVNGFAQGCVEGKGTASQLQQHLQNQTRDA